MYVSLPAVLNGIGQGKAFRCETLYGFKWGMTSANMKGFRSIEPVQLLYFQPHLATFTNHTSPGLVATAIMPLVRAACRLR